MVDKAPEEMAVEKKHEKRQYVRILTSGWRFTLPMTVRRALGWKEGDTLIAHADGSGLELFSPNSHRDGEEEPAGPTSDSGLTGYSSPVYLGSGGKLVVPVEIRDQLGWEVGQKLAVTIQGDHAFAAPCCPETKCRSCGRTANVRQVIPNLYLCEECWRAYVTAAWKSFKETQSPFRKLARQYSRRYN